MSVCLQDNIELFYKFSPLLMQNIPKETVDVWIAKRGKLESRKLIPALVQYDHLKYRAQVCTGLRYVQGSYVFRAQICTGYSCMFRAQICTGVRYVQG